MVQDKPTECEKTPDIVYEDDKRKIVVDFDKGEWVVFLITLAALGIAGCFKWVL